ncbi:MAG: hypothetical protein HRU38_20550 [Saccharospirillaceae bacterium]|nr:response regulator [Pseudomonadales bacterium]NRB81024.1 hypothetical protein [Saccharospirillaceae bacterium]
MVRASEYEVINVAALGIKEEDVERLERYFVLDSKNRFNVIGPDKLSKAHMIIVNADHRLIDRKMEVINRQYRFSGILSLSEHRKLVNGTSSIKRPLNHRHINEAVSRLMTNKPDINDRDKCRVLIMSATLFGHFEIKKWATELYEGLDIVNVYDMAQAQSMLDMHHFDIVFISEGLPDMDSFEACRWIKQNYDCSVIVTKHKVGPITRMKAKLANADDVLAWPIKSYQFQNCFEREMLKVQSQKEAHFIVHSTANQESGLSTNG